MVQKHGGDIYYPSAESREGWRWLKSREDVRSVGGMDPDILHLACEYNAQFGHPSAVVIIRHGWLVAEWYEHHAWAAGRFNVWSCTKSFSGTAYGLLFEDCRQGKLPPDKTVDLDTPAYRFIPEGHPLTDPRKEKITLRHLLTMTSGIPGERFGLYGVQTETGVGPFEAALGFCPCKAREWPGPRWTRTLQAEPGTVWDYSDPAMVHLALAFHHITGREMSDVLQERVLGPIGIADLAWDKQGGGAGFIGPHTNAHTGIYVSARDLARFGYLMLQRGVWEGKQLVAEWWVDLATKPSQPHNPDYGYTWWVNTNGTRWPGLPRDAFACMGLATSKCYVIPSLDLVVARLGAGPLNWSDGPFIERIASAVIDR